MENEPLFPDLLFDVELKELIQKCMRKDNKARPELIEIKNMKFFENVDFGKLSEK